MADNNDLLVPRFYVEPVKDELESKKQGRPIYRDVEMCEIRMAANKQTIPVFPAHDVWQTQIGPDGEREDVSYAMRFPEQYRRFKANEAQALTGTPLEELPFLTAAKRMELKALSILTAEALAALDGQSLKNLGMGGRELKNQAVAYLENATGSAVVTRLAAENTSLQQQLAALMEDVAKLKAAKLAQMGSTESTFSDWEPADLKDWIKNKTGKPVRGNPSLATLVGMADQIVADEMADEEAEAA